MDKTPKIVSLLSQGQDNAKTAKELQALLGYRNLRDVSKEINTLRNKGWIILSSVTGVSKGYFLPSTYQEVKIFVRTMYSRISEIKKATKSAQKELSRWGGE